MTEIMEQQEQVQEGVPFLSRIKNMFSRESSDQEEPRYRRRFFDGRIERYLDENFNNYIDEFGLVTKLDTVIYEEKSELLGQRILGLKTFAKDADADVSSLERRLATVKKEASKSKKTVKK